MESNSLLERVSQFFQGAKKKMEGSISLMVDGADCYWVGSLGSNFLVEMKGVSELIPQEAIFTFFEEGSTAKWR